MYSLEFLLLKNITNSRSLTHILFAAAINIQPNPVRFAQLTSKYWEDFGHLRPGWKNLNYNLPPGCTLSNSSDVCQSVGRLVDCYNIFEKYPSVLQSSGNRSTRHGSLPNIQKSGRGRKLLCSTLSEPSNPGEKPFSRIGQPE